MLIWVLSLCYGGKSKNLCLLSRFMFLNMVLEQETLDALPSIQWRPTLTPLSYVATNYPLIVPSVIRLFVLTSL